MPTSPLSWSQPHDKNVHPETPSKWIQILYSELGLRIHASVQDSNNICVQGDGTCDQKCIIVTWAKLDTSRKKTDDTHTRCLWGYFHIYLIFLTF